MRSHIYRDYTEPFFLHVSGWGTARKLTVMVCMKVAWITFREPWATRNVIIIMTLTLDNSLEVSLCKNMGARTAHETITPKYLGPLGQYSLPTVEKRISCSQ